VGPTGCVFTTRRPCFELEGQGGIEWWVGVFGENAVLRVWGRGKRLKEPRPPAKKLGQSIEGHLTLNMCPPQNRELGE